MSIDNRSSGRVSLTFGWLTAPVRRALWDAMRLCHVSATQLVSRPAVASGVGIELILILPS